MRSPQTRRSGFTLVELLAVNAAVSLLGTQIFDAILQTREAANRTQCMNHLKIIGLALHNYHDSQGALPPGWVGGDDSPKQPNVFGLNGWGMQMRLAPYLDEAPLFNEINHTISVTDKQNAAVVSKAFATLRCPSDPFNKKTWMLKDADGKDVAQVGTANYVGSFGTGDFGKCEKMKPGETCEGDGLYYHNSFLRMRDIKDGLSNTLGIGERSMGAKLDRMTTWSGVFPKAKSPFARILGTSDQALDAKEKNVSSYGSAHKGLVYFINMDGSIRALNTDTDLKVFQALTTRAGGEEISE